MSFNPSKVQFIENHLPSLEAGEYTIQVEQDLKINEKIKETYKQNKTFYIACERFSLPIQCIHSVFPPESSEGEYSTVLPHIVLNRSTLPWERNTGKDTTIPWLALLLLHENDRLEEIKKINLLDARQDSELKFNSRFPKEYQEQDENISIIKIPEKLIKNIIPNEEELKLLTHVRQVSESEEKATEVAVIIGNRLPQPGRNIVHLVSLENYFTYNSQEQYQDFVSLKSWEFHCQAGNSQNRFRHLLESLNADNKDKTNTLRRPQHKANQDAEQYLSQGYVPLIHHLRNSDKTISWYQSPLLPGENKVTSPADLSAVDTPDQLLRYLTELDMFDVSYAAAYKLGQLLALQDQKFSQSLYNWKQQNYRHQRYQKIGNENKSKSLEILFAQTLNSSPEKISIPEDIKVGLERVYLLKNIPFNYLVPDPMMLPQESIRFFWVNNQWLNCCMNGALSLGNLMNFEKMQTMQTEALKDYQNQTITGFLLHSILLSEFPALKIKGFGDQILPCLRMEYLSNTVLICLFEGEVKQIEISAGAEILHFGLETSGEKFKKTLREQPEKEVFIDEKYWKNQPQKILNIIELSKQLVPSQSDASQFALNMIEGSPKAIFKLSSYSSDRCYSN